MTKAPLVKKSPVTGPQDQDPAFCSPFCSHIVLSKQVIFLSFPGSEIWQIRKVDESSIRSLMVLIFHNLIISPSKLPGPSGSV